MLNTLSPALNKFGYKAILISGLYETNYTLTKLNQGSFVLLLNTFKFYNKLSA